VLKDLWAQQPVSSQETAATEGEGSAPDLSAEEASADAQAPQPTEENQLQAVSEAPFLTRFKAILEKHLTDSDLSVEDLGTEVGLSRVQLYRKVKALTGRSPGELLRTARLQRARQMLLTTDKTISEVAYDVGFSAPSYFTKCFRDEFGISPSELTNKQ
jgi:AraC-like DNA-binding protein